MGEQGFEFGAEEEVAVIEEGIEQRLDAEAVALCLPADVRVIRVDRLNPCLPAGRRVIRVKKYRCQKRILFQKRIPAYRQAGLKKTTKKSIKIKYRDTDDTD